MNKRNDKIAQKGYQGDKYSIWGDLSFQGPSLLAQLENNSPTMRETWVQSLGWEDPLEKGKSTHSSILAWRIPWTV